MRLEYAGGKNIFCVNTDGIRTRNRWIRSPTRYPIAPQCQCICHNFRCRQCRNLEVLSEPVCIPHKFFHTPRKIKHAVHFTHGANLRGVTLEYLFRTRKHKVTSRKFDAAKCYVRTRRQKKLAVCCECICNTSGEKKFIQPMARFELATPCLQGRCNNHYATSAHLVNMLYRNCMDTANGNVT